MAAKKKAAKKKGKKRAKATRRAHARIRTADVSLRVRSRSAAGDKIVAKIEALLAPGKE
jgi:hypothetical protein